MATIATNNIVPAEPRHFAYIDAVRGLAFLAVLFNHVAKIDGCFPGWWAWNVGYYGVQLFFLASSITLCYSMESRKTKDKRPVYSFFIRRLFRICPMYWLAILLYWTLPFECIRNDWLIPFSGETGPTVLDFGLNALLLHGWVPSAFNSVVPGGWSIGVEMIFYLIFPVLFFKINSLSRATLGAIVGTVFAIIYFQKIAPYCQAHFYSDNKTPWFFTQFGFLAQLPCFFIGIFIYHLLRNENVRVLTKNKTGSIYRKRGP